ncbi:MAG: hypothetical protein KC619_26910 [Myxococcales bacterium]|nr:hypothetical protein [Myxococcales bacterium]
MTIDTVALLLTSLGAATGGIALGAFLVALLRWRHRDAEETGGWRGTVGAVVTPIPAGGVGRIAHHRQGVRATLPARLLDDGEVAFVGAPMVVIEVRHGVAVVAPLG